MSAPEWPRVKQLFQESLEQPTERRRDWLEEACGGDDALRRETLSLLDAHQQAETGFLSVPPEALFQDPLVGQRLGDYRTTAFLGAGGMGTVYRAVRDDGEFRKEVAVKVVPQALRHPAARERFRTEREILARLDHPGIARLLDGGTTGEGLPYLVMELVLGVPITQFVIERRLSLPEIVALFGAVCDAVHYAHRNLVVHRDIKPSNLLVTADGRPRLLDFGIARLVEADTGAALPTATALHAVTPEYASPEQMRGETITTSSDVYSLGVLLYELLAGRPPYEIDRSRPAEMVRVVCEQTPPPPSHAVHALRGDLDSVVLKALAKVPERRYVSADALAADLRAHVRGFPVSARPDSWTYRMGAFVRRNAKATLAAVLALLGVLGFAATLAVQSARLARERDRAERQAQRAAAVTRFLSRTLAAAHPQTGLGREATVLEALESARAELANGSLDSPDIAAGVRATMAESYAALGRLADAEALAREALSIQERELGEDSLEVAETLRILGDVMRERGNLDEASRLLQRSLGLREAQLGTDHVDVGRVLHELAAVHWTRGDAAAALSCGRRAVQILEARLGEANQEVAVGLGNLATYLEAAGQAAEAKDVYRRTLRLWRTLRREKSPGYAGAASNLGMMLRDEGALDEAEPLLREAVAIDREVLGERHANVGASLTAVAGLVHTRGRHTEARELYAEATSILEEVYGPAHWTVGRARERWGRCLLEDGRLAEAERLLLPAYQILSTTVGPQDDRTQDARTGLVSLYESWHRPADAERFRRTP